jgi:hypothetical protein
MGYLLCLVSAAGDPWCPWWFARQNPAIETPHDPPRINARHHLDLVASQLQRAEIVANPAYAFKG